jgi:hypothetical protein
MCNPVDQEAVDDIVHAFERTTFDGHDVAHALSGALAHLDGFRPAGLLTEDQRMEICAAIFSAAQAMIDGYPECSPTEIRRGALGAMEQVRRHTLPQDQRSTDVFFEADAFARTLRNTAHSVALIAMVHERRGLKLKQRQNGSLDHPAAGANRPENTRAA